MSYKNVTVGSRLGFIGLGYLGSRIAHRLVSAGFPMTVFDRDTTKAVEFAALGCRVPRDAAELAGDVDVLLSCLPTESAVEDVYLQAGTILSRLKPGARVVELSTIAPETSRRLHEAGRQFDVPVLDVSVSGSTLAAEAGRLTLFGGGDRALFDTMEPIFTAIAHQWFYMGPAGSGVSMKLVVNTLLGLGMQAVAEAVALGERLELPRDLLLDTLAKTAVVAPAHSGKLATAKRDDYTPQFPVRLMRKDFALVLRAAAQFGLSMPATEAAAQVNLAEAASGREEDFSAVIRWMEEQALPSSNARTGAGKAPAPAVAPAVDSRARIQ
jgi:3-hydroxyisobutyrate dehydrogenase-like beta-hydroxyacid dehydrogenase